MLLVLGSFAAKIGALAWIAGMMSRSMDALRGRLSWLFLFVGSLGVAQLSVVIIEPTQFAYMDTAVCYLAVALFIPSLLVGTGSGAAHKGGWNLLGALFTARG